MVTALCQVTKTLLLITVLLDYLPDGDVTRLLKALSRSDWGGG